MKKLVRDRIPDIIMQSGQVCVVSKVMERDDKKAALINKLKEEVNEFIDLVETNTVYSRSGELEELADIMEVCFSYAKNDLIAGEEELLEIMYEKRKNRGSFDKFYVVDFGEK